MADIMAAYQKRRFAAPIADGSRVCHDIYERGEGVPVIIMQEMPGIGPETLTLAELLIDEGFRIVLPHMFGPLGRISMLGNFARVMCMRREFRLFEKRESSPVVDWLRALCRDVREATGVEGVGVIGMCLTGNFAMSLMADESVLAAVASQPSMPALHMSEADAEGAYQRLTEHGPMLAYRIEKDFFCRPAMFDAIDRRFNDDGNERVKLVTLPGKGHSVLTLDFVDRAGHPTRDALDEIFAYFKSALPTKSD